MPAARPQMRYDVEAFNTATASTNRIHDDEVARTFGFRGGLVPGVDVYAYMTRLPMEAWGRDWLGGGSIDARLRQPVYDGERVSVVGTAGDGDGVDGVLELAVVGPGGDDDVRATGTARLAGDDASLDDVSMPAVAPLPDERAPAGPDSLIAGSTLGTFAVTFDASAAVEYLGAVRETLPVYERERIAHPGWLLRQANTALASNVVLGPWIHVGSEVSFGRVVADGDELEVRATVLDEHARGGHRFVVLDVAALVANEPAMRVTHTAIHTPAPRDRSVMEIVPDRPRST